MWTPHSMELSLLNQTCTWPVLQLGEMCSNHVLTLDESTCFYSQENLFPKKRKRRKMSAHISASAQLTKQVSLYT